MKHTITLVLLLALMPGCAFLQQARVDQVGDYLSQIESATSVICAELDSEHCDKAEQRLRAARLLAERLGLTLEEALALYEEIKHASR